MVVQLCRSSQGINQDQFMPSNQVMTQFQLIPRAVPKLGSGWCLPRSMGSPGAAFALVQVWIVRHWYQKHILEVWGCTGMKMYAGGIECMNQSHLRCCDQFYNAGSLQLSTTRFFLMVAGCLVDVPKTLLFGLAPFGSISSRWTPTSKSCLFQGSCFFMRLQQSVVANQALFAFLWVIGSPNAIDVVSSGMCWNAWRLRGMMMGTCSFRGTSSPLCFRELWKGSSQALVLRNFV